MNKRRSKCQNLYNRRDSKWPWCVDVWSKLVTVSFSLLLSTKQNLSMFFRIPRLQQRAADCVTQPCQELSRTMSTDQSTVLYCTFRVTLNLLNFWIWSWRNNSNRKHYAIVIPRHYFSRGGANPHLSFLDLDRVLSINQSATQSNLSKPQPPDRSKSHPSLDICVELLRISLCVCFVACYITMPLTAIPLLDPKGESFEVPDKLDPRTFVDLLDRHKGLIFRRCRCRRGQDSALSVDDFGQFVVDCQLQDYPYVGGAAPRRVIPVQVAPGRDIVFTANERYVQYTNPSKRQRTSFFLTTWTNWTLFHVHFYI